MAARNLSDSVTPVLLVSAEPGRLQSASYTVPCTRRRAARRDPLLVAQCIPRCRQLRLAIDAVVTCSASLPLLHSSCCFRLRLTQLRACDGIGIASNVPCGPAPTKLAQREPGGGLVAACSVACRRVRSWALAAIRLPG